MTAPLLGLETTLSVTGADQVVGSIGAVRGAVEEATESTSVLDSVFERLSERFAAYEVLRETVNVMKDFAAAGMEASHATQLLDFQLARTHGDFTGLAAAADKAIGAVSQLGLSTGTDLTTALQRLTLVTGNAEWATSHLKVAQDIAAATGMDLVSASTDLGRAYNGVWIQLERLGLVTKEQVESGGAMDALIAKTEGATEAATAGAGAWSKLWTEMKNAFDLAAEATATASAPAPSFLSRFLFEPGMDFEHLFPALSTKETGPLGAGNIPVSNIFGGSYTGTPLTGPNAPGAPALPGARLPSDALGIQEQALEYQKISLETELKTTTDIAKRLELMQKILEVSQKLHDLVEAHAPIPGWGATNLGSQLVGGGMLPPSAAIAQMFTQQQTTMTGLGQQGALGPGGAQFQNYYQSMQNQLDALKDKLAPVAEGVGGAISRGISAGLSSGHDRVLNALRAMGEEILGVIGGLLVKRGETLLAAGLAEAGTSLFAGNAARDIAGGTAMIAIGSALSAVGSGGGGGGAGGSGGGGSGGYAPSGVGIASRQFMTPSATEGYAAGTQWPGRGISSPHITVIGPGDASAQYGMQRLMQNMVRRGMTAPGIGG